MARAKEIIREIALLTLEPKIGVQELTRRFDRLLEELRQVRHTRQQELEALGYGEVVAIRRAVAGLAVPWKKF